MECVLNQKFEDCVFVSGYRGSRSPDKHLRVLGAAECSDCLASVSLVE